MERFRDRMDNSTFYYSFCYSNTFFALLYSMEEIKEPQLTVKAIASNGIGLMNMET